MILIYVLCIKGDTELNEYMDSLAREPERLTTPHNTDTGETILHSLAKEDISIIPILGHSDFPA